MTPYDSGEATDSPASDTPELALNSLTETMVSWLALQARARAYEARVDRAIETSARAGASIEEIADAAGLSAEEVRRRLLA